MRSINIWNYVVFLWIYSGLLRNVFPSLNTLLYLLPFLLSFFYLVTSRARNKSAETTRNFLIFNMIITFSIQVLHYLSQDISLRNVFTGLVLYSLAPSIVFLCMNIDSDLLLLKLVKVIKMGIPINLFLTFLQVVLNLSFFRRSQINGLESMTTDGKVLRAIGTFSHSVGYSTFLSIATVIVIYIYRQETKKYRALWILQISLLYLLSGSRTVFVNLFVIVLMLALINLRQGVRTNRTKSKMIFNLLVPVLLVYFLVKFQFNLVLDSFATRIAAAAEQENTLMRILNQNFGWINHMQDSIWGQGLGFFSTGTIGFSSNRSIWVEDDLLRVILEAGSIFGLFVIALRWVLPIVIYFKISRNPNENSSTLMLLLAAVFPNLVQGALTGQGSVAIQVWLIVGICLSSIYEFKDRRS